MSITDKELEQIFDRVVGCPTITKLLENGKTKEAARGSMLLSGLEILSQLVGKEIEQKQNNQTKETKWN